MSRIGKQEIIVPENVTITVTDGGNFNYKTVKVTGPKGELEMSIRRGVTFDQKDNVFTVSRLNDSKQVKSYHGLYRSIIANMVEGVTNGYEKELEIVGIGYRAEQQGQNVVFSLGYSHKITLTPPQGVVVEVLEPTKVKVSGYDKQKVGQTAAEIRAYRKPEPYKGKGVKYSDEQIRRKSVKGV